jgi:hypothetical protein
MASERLGWFKAASATTASAGSRQLVFDEWVFTVLSDLRLSTQDDTSSPCGDSSRPKYPSGLFAQSLYLQREATNYNALTANGGLTSSPNLTGFTRGCEAEVLLLEHTLGKLREEHCKTL